MQVNFALDDGACLLILWDGLSQRVRFLCQSRSVFRRLQAEHFTSFVNLSARGALTGSLYHSLQFRVLLKTILNGTERHCGNDLRNALS